MELSKTDGHFRRRHVGEDGILRPYGSSLPTRQWSVWLRYLSTIVLFGLIILLQAEWGEAAQFPFLFFFSSIILSGVLFDHGASLLTTALAAGVLAFFAWKPEYAFYPPAAPDWIGWGIFVVVALITAGLVELLHNALNDLRHVNEALVGSNVKLDATNQALSASEQEKDVLLQEFAHRTRNDFAQLIGMIKLEERAAGNDTRLQERLRLIADRVQVYSRLQNRLYRSQKETVVHMQDFIRDLCRDFQQKLSTARPIEIEAHAETRPVPEQTAVAIGLIVNELVTNALKHAFPDNREGKIIVTFRVPDGECALCVEDDGVGIENAPVTAADGGLGHKLIRSLTDQLQGTYELRPRRDGSGTIATVRFRAG